MFGLKNKEEKKEKKIQNIIVPSKYLKITRKISDMKEGDSGYINTSVFYDEKGLLWISKHADIKREESAFEDIKITKLKEGFEVDLSKCDSEEWCKISFGDSGQPVISLKGLEKLEENIKKRKEKLKLQEYLVKSALKKLEPEDRVILGYDDGEENVSGLKMLGNKLRVKKNL